MEVGDIVFFKGKSWISRIISKLTGSPYTHVAIAISPERILEANRFIKVSVREIAEDEIYSIQRYESLTKQQKFTIYSGSTAYIGARYDYLNNLIWLIKLIINKDGHGFVNNANKVYCSELIDRVYLLAGIDLVPDRKDGDVLPVHLLNSPLLTEVYNTEGGE